MPPNAAAKAVVEPAKEEDPIAGQGIRAVLLGPPGAGKGTQVGKDSKASP